MAGFLALLLALVGVVCLASYWMSWEIQDKRRRPTFTAMLWSDAARLLGRNSGRIPVSERQSHAAHGAGRCPGGEITPANAESGTL